MAVCVRAEDRRLCARISSMANDAKTTAQSARCCACTAVLLSLVSLAAVGAAGYFSSSIVTELRDLANNGHEQASSLKMDHSHLVAQLTSMR